MKKSDRAESADGVRAIETVPTTCRSPVTDVRSSGIAGNPSLRRAGLIPACTICIIGLFGGSGV